MTPTRTTRVAAALVLAGNRRLRRASCAPRRPADQRSSSPRSPPETRRITGSSSEMGEKWQKATTGEVDLRDLRGRHAGQRGRQRQADEHRPAAGRRCSRSAGSRKSIRRSPRSRKSRCCSDSLAEEEYVRDKMRPELEKRLLAQRLRRAVLGRQRLGAFLLAKRGDAARTTSRPMKIFVTASNSAKEMQIMQALGYTPGRRSTGPTR